MRRENELNELAEAFKAPKKSKKPVRVIVCGTDAVHSARTAAANVRIFVMHDHLLSLVRIVFFPRRRIRHPAIYVYLTRNAARRQDDL